MTAPRLQAVEILRRSEQGLCRPFLIRDDKGDVYVVKGVDGVGKAALASELICAELGKRLGLPIPPYGLMQVPQPLIDFSAIDGIWDLEGGPAFASRLIENATTLVYSQMDYIKTTLQQRVLVFDKWVKNGDRCLTKNGGNVNLLWSPDKGLGVIDHNVAFAMETPDHEILIDHVFAGQRHCCNDMVTRAEHIAALDNTLTDWDRITALLPEEWVYRDLWDEDSEVSPTLEERYALLQRFNDDDFWRLA